MKDLEAQIEEELSHLNVELVAVEDIVEPVGRIIRVYIDRPGGIDIQTCSEVNELLVLKLDREIGGKGFSLEVSSPGIERILSKPKHFQEHLGERVNIRAKDKIEGRKNFKGLLENADEEVIFVNCEGMNYRIPYNLIRRANLVVDF